MRIFSMFEAGIGYKITEVEVTLLAGLPDLKIMGLPDQSVRESAMRIKAAIKQQGYQFPQRQQILVNLHPSNVKKSGRGLELAIVTAFLLASEQVRLPDGFCEDVFVYGEIGMDGTVRTCPEVEWARELLPRAELVTGADPIFTGEFYGIRNLQDLARLGECRRPGAVADFLPCRPEFGAWQWSPESAQRLAVIAMGGHHTLLAGPAGSGKTTLAESLFQVLPDLSGDEMSDLRRWNLRFQRDPKSWRPFCRPHHSTSMQGMLGGGNPVVPGEVTRAHLGVLLLDEFLEFSTVAREGLREPMEKSQVQITRSGSFADLPTQFQLLATTNLCPCGDFVPLGECSNRCRFSLRKCRSYMERLSGPLVDRFDILVFTRSERRERANVGLAEIAEQVRKGVEFARSCGRTPGNGRLTWLQVVAAGMDKNVLAGLPTGASTRRQLAVLRVARTIADLDGVANISFSHISQAMEIAWVPFEQLSHPFL